MGDRYVILLRRQREITKKMEDFEFDLFENMDLDFVWGNKDLLSSAILECEIDAIDEGNALPEADVFENSNAPADIVDNYDFFPEVLLENDDAKYKDHLMYTIVNPTTNTPEYCKISQNQQTNFSNIKEEEVNKDLSAVANGNYDSSSDSGVDQGESEKNQPTLQQWGEYSSLTILSAKSSKKESRLSLLKKKVGSKSPHSPRKKYQNEHKKLSQNKSPCYHQKTIKRSQKYHITKEEEQQRKQMQRKMRNRESAQESRRRKKMYISSLEARVKEYSIKTCELMKHVEILKVQNKILLKQSNLKMDLPLD